MMVHGFSLFPRLQPPVEEELVAVATVQFGAPAQSPRLFAEPGFPEAELPLL